MIDPVRAFAPGEGRWAADETKMDSGKQGFVRQMVRKCARP